MLTRKLGRSGIEVSAIGMGCWAIGGPFKSVDGRASGWGEVNDEQSVWAVRRAVDLGITFFDTADVYGCGHSEEILAQALAGRRDRVVIATKFGFVFDADRKEVTGRSSDPQRIRQACEASLRRLGTDVIDLYQFHYGNCDLAEAVGVRDALERLVEEGKIRAYGWSTDDPDRARLFAEGPNCAAVQQALNIFQGNLDTLEVCEEQNLASINRNPLDKGLLTGKFTSESKFPANDIRSNSWDFKDGLQAERLSLLQELRKILTSDGRTLAQAALGWLLARSENTIPIPGFKTVEQVEENAGAGSLSPLTAEQMDDIEAILSC